MEGGGGGRCFGVGGGYFLVSAIWDEGERTWSGSGGGERVLHLSCKRRSRNIVVNQT